MLRCAFITLQVRKLKKPNTVIITKKQLNKISQQIQKMYSFFHLLCDN